MHGVPYGRRVKEILTPVLYLREGGRTIEENAGFEFALHALSVVWFRR